jgi:hypothetical protein
VGKKSKRIVESLHFEDNYSPSVFYDWTLRFHALAAGLSAGFPGGVASRYYPGWLGYFMAFGIGFAKSCCGRLVDHGRRAAVLAEPEEVSQSLGVSAPGGPGELLFSLVAGSFLVIWLYRLFTI